MKNNRICMEEVLNPLLAQGCRVFSLTGSGGKTTLIRNTALYYAKNMHVGVATSTKMYLPDNGWQHRGVIPPVVSPGCVEQIGEVVPPICFYTEHILPEGKIWDIGEAMMQRALQRSEILLVEADGSNRKPLKGWREGEPVILPQTDVTIGILPLHCLGKTIDETMVHRMEAFTALTGLGCGDMMTIDAYIQLVIHPEGLFSHAKGKRLLVLNRADNDFLYQAAGEIATGSGFGDGEWIAGCLLDE